MRGAARTLVYLDKHALACNRIWCLFEIWTALTLHGDVEQGGLAFITKNRTNEMTRVFSKIDISKASATVPDDIITIMKKIRQAADSPACTYAHPDHHLPARLIAYLVLAFLPACSPAYSPACPPPACPPDCLPACLLACRSRHL